MAVQLRFFIFCFTSTQISLTWRISDSIQTAEDVVRVFFHREFAIRLLSFFIFYSCCMFLSIVACGRLSISVSLSISLFWYCSHSSCVFFSIACMFFFPAARFLSISLCKRGMCSAFELIVFWGILVIHSIVFHWRWSVRASTSSGEKVGDDLFLWGFASFSDLKRIFRMSESIFSRRAMLWALVRWPSHVSSRLILLWIWNCSHLKSTFLRTGSVSNGLVLVRSLPWKFGGGEWEILSILMSMTNVQWSDNVMPNVKYPQKRIILRTFRLTQMWNVWCSESPIWITWNISFKMASSFTSVL